MNRMDHEILDNRCRYSLSFNLSPVVAASSRSVGLAGNLIVVAPSKTELLLSSNHFVSGPVGNSVRPRSQNYMKMIPENQEPQHFNPHGPQQLEATSNPFATIFIVVSVGAVLSTKENRRVQRLMQRTALPASFCHDSFRITRPMRFTIHLCSS